MRLVRWVGIFQILVGRIGKLWSGFWSTWGYIQCMFMLWEWQIIISWLHGCRYGLWLSYNEVNFGGLISLLLVGLCHDQDRNIVYCDSQSIIYLSKNASFHSKSKHIDVRFVRDMQITWVDKIHTDKNK